MLHISLALPYDLLTLPYNRQLQCQVVEPSKAMAPCMDGHAFARS